ncbi:uncharacterized protein LOC122381546, partial [Amphibalanus amphitrite]|uniref:uncharacterized protein LOC122381546 n=1 Tax=Amphibalanus amphitrite TaxID=1232801 RepID=UPI001C925E3F
MFNPHSLNGDRLERYHDLHLRGKYPLGARASLPMDLSAMKTSTWTYKPAMPLQTMIPHHQPAPEKQMRFRPEKAHRRPVQRLQWRKSKWQGDADEPSSYLDLNRISSMTIADVSPKFAVKRILQMYENQQYREAANFVNRLSHGTFKVILTDLPVDVFIESMPDSLPILEALYAKVFLSDGLNFSVKTLKPDAVVMQMVKFFAQQEDSLTGNIKWEQCGPFIASCKKLLKVIIHTDPKIKKMLVGRRKALDKAIEGMGHHGMVGTSDGSLMNLHDALKLEFKKVVTSYKAALEKLEELSLSTSSKQTISRSISHGPAPIQVSHQRQLSITQQEIQERLIKNKTILNVVEPILGNHSLDVFLGILQRRIDHDKDCLFHFTQLKKEVKDMQDATVVVPILMRYGNGIDQVLKLMRDVSGDQEESDGSDISGYHSDSDSAIMTSGNSPYVSKSARYNFLYRS